jgi:hypothetical protein
MGEVKKAKNGRYYVIETVNGRRRSRFISNVEAKKRGAKGAGFRTGGGLKLKKPKVKVSSGIKIGALRVKSSIGSGFHTGGGFSTSRALQVVKRGARKAKRVSRKVARAKEDFY